MKKTIKTICAAAIVSLIACMIPAADTNAASLCCKDQHGHDWKYQIVENNGVRSAEVIDVVLPPNEAGQQTNSFHYVLEIPEIMTDESGNEYEVTGVGDGGFAGNDEVHIITFPSSLTRVGNNAFDSCENLFQLGYYQEGISKDVRTIGENAFTNCPKLKTVYFTAESELESIGDGAFEGCGTYSYGQGLTIKALRGSCAHWFAKDNGFRFIPINGSGEIVEDSYLYKDDNGITWEYVIADDGSAKIIGPVETSAANGALSYTVPGEIEGRKVTAIADGGFSRSSAVSVALPESITSIGDRVFKSCPQLENVSLPDGLKEIGSYAFSDCGKLWESRNNYLELPGSLESIGSHSFCGLNFECQVRLPEGMKSLGDYSFSRCDHAFNIYIPSSLEHMGKHVLSDSRFFHMFIVSDDNLAYKAVEGVLYSKDGEVLVSCPKYKNTGNAVDFTVPDGVVSIGEGAFEGCSIGSIRFPQSLSSIEPQAFMGCENLKEVRIPESVVSIGKEAFKGCESLERAFIPGNVKSIGEKAFSGCNAAICGEMGTYAETYATRNKIEFIEVYRTEYVDRNIRCSTSAKVRVGRSVRITGDRYAGKYRYSSLTPGIAKVSSKGTVTAKAPGTAKIKVRLPERSTVNTKNGVTVKTIYREKTMSVRVKCALSKPNVNAKSLSGRKARIEWSRVQGATGYKIYVKFPGKTKYKCVLTKSAKVKAVTHKGLKRGAVYSYKVKAFCKRDGKIWYSDFSKADAVKAGR
ncbi:MAG: leucine-rich repeat protein [Firmicutes bacterium]|nr:leucine-rich repeat protein [Bacillota bacterium]